MDKKTSVNFTAPILLGFLSLLGICVVLGSSFYKGGRAPATVVPTQTPFRYTYLGTEPGFTTLTPEATPTLAPPPTEADDEVIVEPTDFARPSLAPTIGNTPGNTPVSTQTTVRTAAPTITPTIAFILSKVDDNSLEILYDGDWETQSNVSGTHQNTLHISFATGNAALFTFVGKQVIISYQAAPSLGSININLDGTDYTVSQSSSQTQLVDWTSPTLDLGVHTLLIEHISGGSVNLDAISVPDYSTPTPTSNPS